MPAFTFYKTETGIFHMAPFVGPNEAAALANAPAGFGVRPGRYDHKSQRFDQASDTVVDYTPPDPEPISPDERKQALVAALKSRMAAVELDEAHGRALRDVALAQLAGTSIPQAAVDKLEAIETSLTPIRAVVEAIQVATTHDQLDAIELAGLP